MPPVRQTPTTANFGPSISGDDYAEAVNVEVEALWNRTHQALDSVSGTNTILATTSPALTGYAKNQEWDLVPANTNSGPTQINIDGNGLRDIKAADGTAMVGGELVAGVLTKLTDTGTYLRMHATVIASVNALTSIFSLTKATNVAGGTATAGARQTYPLNTSTLNEIAGASLNVAGLDINKVNLPAGTYEVDANAQFWATLSCKLALFDQTAGADIVGVVASQGYASNPGKAALSGKFSLLVPSIIVLQYRVNSTSATNGLGVPNALGEAMEYGFIRFKKVA